MASEPETCGTCAHWRRLQSFDSMGRCPLSVPGRIVPYVSGACLNYERRPRPKTQEPSPMRQLSRADGDGADDAAHSKIGIKASGVLGHMQDILAMLGLAR